MDQDGLYQRQVIERARAPVHAGPLDGATHQGEGTNPMCGDRVRLGVTLDAAGRVVMVRHQTRGCAICVASADMMADLAPGRSVAELGVLSRAFTDMLRTGGDAPNPELATFAGLHRHRSRIRCATLPWSALDDALNESKEG
ncbi:SUF system FeS assembly protein, NifU family [Gluconacetobacter diazotrophicus PA1 5]|uniref:Putative nitrogen fixation protein nifU n=1 Tax=Gluconacetobacter diazotrophicus (strain ATCC 49037 / DSM 5601 / CCUG 37298 / CIP 103539 / LMG 7603 / PAl5) TaxID=272568 RepID=A9HRX9_GLUDA|nr:SUF system NifU family Fe-S cluster assembly protein [Gluconacetobacter diazotrophicus]ACI53040.1 SUF system FeS assembly protein, NifU family [Gluconacetobacter diazotrophicus PA1 5]TWB07711.1 modular FeS cluster scaffolding protein NifU [Gluconacetobacter diazotrophicus]CAP56998.1 putative nitrogen fixation protein nifU [Gluconacetobacter diazotrophicus PA1 5]